MMSVRYCFIVMAVLALLCSCENVSVDEYLSSSGASEDVCSITFTVDSYDIVPIDILGDGETYTRAMVSAGELGTRLSCAVYQYDKKLDQVNQVSTDSSFGTITLALTPGQYEVAIIVHSNDGNPTMTDLTAISWSPKRVTDTFTYYSDLDVTGDATYNISLSRRVAQYAFTITTAIPTEVTQMQFYYTGGSSTLDITTGYGSVQSRQTETRDVTSYDAEQTFYLYTFPHTKEDVLAMTVTALDDKGRTVHEVKYTDIPVTLNMQTLHRTDFFGTTDVDTATDDDNGSKDETTHEVDSEDDSDSGGGVRFALQGDDAWNGEIYY